MKEGDKHINLVASWPPKARGVPKSLFRVITPKEMEDMSVSLPCVGQMVHSFFHVFTFALVVEKAWKTKLTHQWIHLFIENSMV